MKNVFVSVMTILTSISAYSSIPKSNGKDLVCSGSATISTPYYTCDTDYGISDHCSDVNVDIDFYAKVIKGDLNHRLLGPIVVNKIISDTSENVNQAMDKQLKSIVQKIHGTISYENKVATLKVQTLIGNGELTKSIDFSKGVQSQGVYLGIDGPADITNKDSGLVVHITVSCEAGTSYNH